MDNPLSDSIVSKKLGPLPVWAWALAGVVVFFVAQRFFFSGGSNSVNQDDGTPADYYDDTNTDTGTGSISSSGVPSAGSSGTGTDTGDGYDIASVTDWAVKAINYLVSKGVSGVDASNTVNAYINTGTVTRAQKSWLDQIFSGIGAPPDGAYPVTVTNPTPATPATPAPKPAASKPGKPTGLRVSDLRKGGATVVWTKVPGATGYTIRTSGAKDPKDNRSWTVTANTVNITGMTDGEKFKVHVSAKNAAGIGPESVLQIDLKGPVKK